MVRRYGVLVFAVASLLMATRTSAHHSFAVMFDSNRPLLLTGVVTTVEWANPHVLFSIDVSDSTGAVTDWNFELGSPNVLLQRGWTPTSLNLDDTVTVDGYGAKDGSHYGSVVAIELGDGRKVFAGSSAGGEYPRDTTPLSRGANPSSRSRAARFRRSA
jgi:hypothetical protein